MAEEPPDAWRWVGRWESDRESTYRFEALVGPAHEKLAVISGGYLVFVNEQARVLTAAAPEMLALLRDVAAMSGDGASVPLGERRFCDGCDGHLRDDCIHRRAEVLVCSIDKAAA